LHNGRSIQQAHPPGEATSRVIKRNLHSRNPAGLLSGLTSRTPYQRQGPSNPVPCETQVQYPLERSLHFHASPRICDARICSARSRFQDIYPIWSPRSLYRQSIPRYTSHLVTPIYQTFTATRFLVRSAMRPTPGCGGTVLKRGARDRKLCRGFHVRPDVTQRP
jgi:hypothetical protein